jgi:hypothetical protein
VPRLFIDGAKAPVRDLPNLRPCRSDPRCQIHNAMERLPKSLHASFRCVLRQASKLDDVAKAERLLRQEHGAAGITGT